MPREFEPRLPRSRLLELLDGQYGLCGICNRKLPTDHRLIHVDHIFPRSRADLTEWKTFRLLALGAT